jgi:hypothetical protein
MKVYLLYNGSLFEKNDLPEVYTYKPNAIAQAGQILKDKIEAKKGRGELGWNKWKEIEPEANVVKAWQSQTEEIIVYEVETK